MSLSLKDIDTIARLARLEPDAGEAQRMLRQLNDLFELVEKMRSIDTAGIEPLAHPLATIQNVALHLADDVVREENQRAANQRSAPAVERGLFLVPRVVE